jgi:hypothetical protein
MSKIILSYKRDDGSEPTSTGTIVAKYGVMEDLGDVVSFVKVPFDRMIAKLSDALRIFDDDAITVGRVEVFLERTDREGLLPYKLDMETALLIRNDPVAAVAAMTYTTASPSTAMRRAKQRDVPIMPAPVRVGTDVMSDAFGDDIYFRVKGHELECPGCGFWSPFTTPGLLKDPERVGSIFSTIFVCQKKCRARFAIRCWERWGTVSVEYLLNETKLDAFYFPRPWNSPKSWVTREELQTKYKAYQKEIES